MVKTSITILLNKIKPIWNLLKKYLFGYASESIVEKKERMIQTYLVVFGLLLSYNRDAEFQQITFVNFIYFMFFSLLYYVLITRFYQIIPRIILNIFPFIIGIFFSGSLFLYFNIITPISDHLFYTILTILLVAISLFV
jgi:hypothetical protein